MRNLSHTIRTTLILLSITTLGIATGCGSSDDEEGGGIDGVYVEGDGVDGPRLVPAVPSSRAELYVLTERVALRVMTWLRKRGYTKDEDDAASNDAPDRTFAEALAQVATQRGTVENVKDDTGESEGLAEPAAPLRDEAVTRHGFNLHASLTIAAEDDLGRERLCRYGLRRRSRFRVLRDGRIVYRVKKSSLVALPNHDPGGMHDVHGRRA